VLRSVVGFFGDLGGAAMIELSLARDLLRDDAGQGGDKRPRSIASAPGGTAQPSRACILLVVSNGAHRETK
jgi:hypothetical protein